MNKLVIAAVALAAAAACSKEESTQKASSTELTSLNTVNNDNAVIRIANARCDREYNCNNIGAGARYQDQNACLRELHQNVQSGLRPDLCPGVDQAKLAKCLADVQLQSCGTSLETTENIATCKRSELCVGLGK